MRFTIAEQLRERQGDYMSKVIFWTPNDIREPGTLCDTKHKIDSKRLFQITIPEVFLSNVLVEILKSKVFFIAISILFSVMYTNSFGKDNFPELIYVQK